MGQSDRGNTGMYRWLHFMGKRREHKISQHTVKRLTCRETSSTLRSQARAYHVNMTLLTSRHSNNTWKGRLT